ncbi:MAG TPA: acyl carrier protein [Aeromonadales bacterium]|nr:acyl carrier protein [Aeromonadales bacterium]
MIVTLEDILSAVEDGAVSVDISEIKGDDSLADAGIDSLEIMSFFLSIEEKFNVKFPDEDVDDLNTINDIIAYMEHL